MNPFRRSTLFILVLLVGAVVAVACTSEDGVSAPTQTPAPPSAPTPDVVALIDSVVRETLGAIPTATPMPAQDIDAIVATVVQETLETLSTTIFRTETGQSGGIPTTGTVRITPTPGTVRITPTPSAVTPEPVQVLEPEVQPGGDRASATPAPAPIASLSRIAEGFSALGFGALPAAQDLSEVGGLTVTASGSVTVTADEAYVVVIPERFYGPRGPEKLSSKDRADVVQNLVDIGIVEDAIEFESGRQYDPESISVEVGMDDLPEIGDLILDAVEDVVRRSERSGVRFSLSEENCDQALAVARQEAIAQAEGDSNDLAEALGVVRTGIIGAAEYPATSFNSGLPGVDKCGSGQFQPYQTPLMPFDADPEIEVSLQMQITYGPKSDQAGGITATASGSVTATADEAYVVVIPEQFYGRSGPEPLSSKDRADVIEAIAQIGIATDNIEIISGRQQYEPVQISVEVEAQDLPEIGDLILDAVEGVLRRSENSGLRFSLSEQNCGTALALARRDAISQIDKNADDLAGAFGIVRGDVVGAVEQLLSDFRYGPVSADRCGGLFQEPYALMPFDAEPSIDVAVQLQITFAPQSDETGGLVAVAGSSMTVTADEAYVVVVPQRFYEPRGPRPLSAEDRADVVDGLTAIGIATEDIEIISGRRPYEPIQISVEVEVADLPNIGERIVDAVEDVLRRSENSGVRFSLLDESCDAALAQGRRDAALQAEKDADGLAEALGVDRGGVVGVLEYTSSGFNYGAPVTETCGGQFQDPYTFLPFDAEPRIEVAVQLQISYAISE